MERRTDEQHAFAKELIAGFAAAEVDKLFETKGKLSQEKGSEPGLMNRPRCV
jgi:hypothetical protein